MKLRMQDERKSALMVQWIRITGVVGAYWFISISMVFLNKYLLSNEDLNLEAPLFITLSQCVVASVCFMCLGTASKYVTHIPFPAMKFNLHTALKILPLSIIFVGSITFTNLTLKYLGVAFYNVGRSLTTVFNAVLSYAVLGQPTSKKVLTCCCIIVIGFLLGVKKEDASAQISFFGVVCGVLASFFVALTSIFIKKTLPSIDNNIWQLQLYNNTNAVVLLTPLMVLFGEIPVLRDFMFWASPSFWGLLIMAGIFGIIIGYITTLQIQVTSPLTHNVSGTAKAGIQTVLACVVYSQTKPLWWWVSNGMVLGGSSAYTYVRMSEMKNNENGGEGGGGEGGRRGGRGGGGGAGEGKGGQEKTQEITKNGKPERKEAEQ